MQRVRLDLLSNKIRDKAIKGKDTVTATQIADFYNKYKARFAEPEKRDLEVVLTKDKATAQKMVAILVDHGWLAPIEGGAVVAGRQRREAWRIVKAG